MKTIPLGPDTGCPLRYHRLAERMEAKELAIPLYRFPLKAPVNNVAHPKIKQITRIIIIVERKLKS